MAPYGQLSGMAQTIDTLDRLLKLIVMRDFSQSITSSALTFWAASDIF